MFSISISRANTANIERLLRSTLKDAQGSDALNERELYSQMDEFAQLLTAGEIESLQPLAMQCLRSSRPQARSSVLFMLSSIVLRTDSSMLVEPYVEALGSLLDEPPGPLRHAVVVVLTMTKPEISAKAIATLTAHVEDKNSSLEESSGIVWALITARTSNPAIRHKVLRYVAKKSEIEITISGLEALHQVRHPDEEALDFMGKSLDHDSTFVRDAAVQDVLGLDRGLRARFAAQLGRIARDSNETERTRSLATEALGK